MLIKLYITNIYIDCGVSRSLTTRWSRWRRSQTTRTSGTTASMKSPGTRCRTEPRQQVGSTYLQKKCYVFIRINSWSIKKPFFLIKILSFCFDNVRGFSLKCSRIFFWIICRFSFGLTSNDRMKTRDKYLFRNTDRESSREYPERIEYDEKQV